MKCLQENYKGHMDNNKGGGWKQGKEVRGGGAGGERQKTVLEQQ